jgi:hypothetical protein
MYFLAWEGPFFLAASLRWMKSFDKKRQIQTKQGKNRSNISEI